MLRRFEFTNSPTPGGRLGACSPGGSLSLMSRNDVSPAPDDVSTASTFLCALRGPAKRPEKQDWDLELERDLALECLDERREIVSVELDLVALHVRVALTDLNGWLLRPPLAVVENPRELLLHAGARVEVQLVHPRAHRRATRRAKAVARDEDSARLCSPSLFRYITSSASTSPTLLPLRLLLLLAPFLPATGAGSS